MEIIEIKESIYKFKIKSHSQIKSKILDSLKVLGTNPIHNSKDRISNQDFFRPQKEENSIPEYMNIFLPSLKDSLDELKYNYGTSLDVDNFWFQQYNRGDNHSWHVHNQSNFSSVYYVECPEGMATEFMLRDGKFQIDAEEGDYIIFPSTLKHQSKENFSDERKTVISVNLNYYPYHIGE